MRILKNGEDTLKQSSLPVDSSVFGTPDIISLKNEMLDIMTMAGGIGLAAPQIGKNIRMFVMGDHTIQFVCINPTITKYSDTQTDYGEGCLSFPGLELNIRRPECIQVVYYNERGEEVEEALFGIWARCFQHEYDHLNGILFTSRVSKMKLDMARTKVKRNLKRKARR